MKYVKIICIFTAILFTASCTNQTTEQASFTKTDTTSVATRDTAITEQVTESEYQDRYILIADTVATYAAMDAEMYRLSKELLLPVDTMNRHYDNNKKEIVLAEDDEDEMYRGEYYPRRSEDTLFLSIEHCNQFIDKSGAQTFALVADICTTKKMADSLMTVIRGKAPNAFVVQAKVYMGCMH